MKSINITLLLVLITCYCNAAEWYQSTDLVNIRSGPGKSYPIVATIAKYDSVIIDSIVQEYEWGQVIVNNKIKGYAAMQYLTAKMGELKHSFSSTNKPSCTK